MSQSNMEIESKFWIADLKRVEVRLRELNAEVVEVRAFESNIRFDTLDSRYSQERKVIRLRKYHDNRLTFKGPGSRQGGALARVEIETVVEDHENTRLILNELGFFEKAVYEKYRAMYSYANSLITLDELPYGFFIEIEGENNEQIKLIATKLGLDPDKAIPASYQGIFEQLKQLLGFKAENLTFEELQGPIDLSILGFEQADQA